MLKREIQYKALHFFLETSSYFCFGMAFTAE